MRPRMLDGRPAGRRSGSARALGSVAGVPGLFVTFEGIDRSGKTTQARMLLDALGDEAVGVREPGGTAAGERVRELLKDPEVELSAAAEALLFAAARAELVAQVIRRRSRPGGSWSRTASSTPRWPTRARRGGWAWRRSSASTGSPPAGWSPT